MKKHKRPTASYIRRFLPSLQRVSTPEGRRWTVDGKRHFETLQDVINASGERKQKLAEILNAGAEKDMDNVATN